MLGSQETPPLLRCARRFWTVPVIALLLTAAFSQAFGLYRYFDDWAFPAAAEQAFARGNFMQFVLAPSGRHWSPIWNLLELVNYRLARWRSDWFIRTLTIAVSAASLAWFAALASRLRLSRLAIVAGMIVLMWHPSNAATLYSFDTYSQAIADLCTWTAGGIALVALTEDRPLPAAWLWAAAAIAAVGMLTKEQGLSGALALVVLLAATVRSDESAHLKRRRAAIAASVVLLVAAFALARRFANVAVDVGGAFRFCPSCTVRNTLLLTGSMPVPFRAAWVFDALRPGAPDYGSLALAGCAVAVVLLALVEGLMLRARTTGWRPIGLCLVLLVTGAFPVSLLGRVGILYVHTLIFWYALLAAYAVQGWLDAGLLRRRAILTLLPVYAAVMLVGLRLNLAEMRRSGERSKAWLAKYTEAIRPLPAGSFVVVHGNPRGRGANDFSLYRITRPEQLVLITGDALRHAVGPRAQIVVDPGPVRGAQVLAAWRSGRKVYDLRRIGTELAVAPWVPPPAPDPADTHGS